MSKENYDAKVAVLEALPQEEVIRPRNPINIYVQEAEDQYVWLQEDLEALVAKGLDQAQFIDDLPIRIGSARHAQSIWMKERFGQEEAAKAWKEESPKAYDLRDGLLADFRFAYRRRPDLLGRVKAIAEGTGDADMIQDLSDISVLGKANTEELATISFDLVQLDEAASRSNELADLLAEANGSRLDDSKARDMRDRAYTHLKEAMDEIRDTGKYVFRKTPERYKGYVSRYKR
ncbi:hypothetical protein [uncultured Aquimarina sp.]|uniref:hypothetical protein n=1 Tax=uncultured Aquimarina sp. TaxID=575652 RepID=UPI00260FC4B2|nr:hypothetical protein [uncultured Aquimarina sp.]